MHMLNDNYHIKGYMYLLQKKNQPPHEYYIHPGCLVRGVGFNNPDKKYTGRVNRIVKNENGEIICLYILTEKNSTMVTIKADDNLELLIKKSDEQKGIHTIAPSYNTTIAR